MGQAHIMKTWRTDSVTPRTVTIKPGAAKKDFVILCPRLTQDDGVAEALQALLYLPQNYKLIIASGNAHEGMMYDEITALANNSSKTSKIKRTSLQTKKTGLPAEASPFSFADAVVYGGPGPTLTEGPSQSLIVFNMAAGREANHDDGHDFRVCANTPEALASAILSVTRG